MGLWTTWIRTLLGGLVAGLALLLVGGCGAEGGAEDPSAGEEGADRRPIVVCTTGMIGDTVRNVVGDRCEVITLMGAGVDPHLYKATRSDIDAILRADIVFYNGLMLEGKMNDLLVRTARQRTVERVTAYLGEGELLEPPEFQGLYDPHVWMDPTLWASAVDVIRDRMSEVDPAYREVYAQNGEAFKQELVRLDAYAKQVLSSIPERSRVLVTAHDAFNYLGRHYRLEVVGIQGLSTESEAAVKDIERLVEMIVERDIRAVFVESTVSTRSIEALIAGARGRGHEVRIGGELFSDAMGPPGTYEGTYIGMIDHNVTTIARALGGDAPEGGMDGRLGH